MKKQSEIYPWESVILAEDFYAMVEWYKNILSFKSSLLVDDEYRYCSLKNKQGIEIGIADSKQMGIKNPNRKNNTVVLQFGVNSVKDFFIYLQKKGETITFGPSFDKSGKFWYGGFNDLEGNPIWVVETNCPK